VINFVRHVIFRKDVIVALKFAIILTARWYKVNCFLCFMASLQCKISLFQWRLLAWRLRCVCVD